MIFFRYQHTPMATKANARSMSRVAKLPQSWLIKPALMLTILLTMIPVAQLQANALPDFSGLVERESDAVVKISVVTSSPQATAGIPGLELDQIPESLRRFFEQLPEMQPDQPRAPRRGQGFGSGFIISSDGYVVTNAHVVDSASDIIVGMNDRREFDAELVGLDKATDVAVLKIDSDEQLPVVRLGNSAEVKVGQWVLAIGAPFGFDYTATQGIVSAVARNLPSDTYVPFIQTDVAVNPGNSGGPLFDTNGQVIGVNSQIYSRSGGYQGLSFAIPINVVKNVVDQIRAKGYASRGWLGVVIQDVSQALAESFNLDKPGGALIASVAKDSPAEAAGLQSGDIVVSFNGHEVESSGKLPPLVGAVAAGETVPVGLLRNGEAIDLDVTIGELDTGDREQAQPLADNSQTSPLGIVVADVGEKEKRALDISGGVVISSVEPRSPAASAGLQPGDIILSINQVAIDDTDGFASIVSDLPTGKSFPVLVQRGNSALFRALQLPSS